METQAQSMMAATPTPTRFEDLPREIAFEILIRLPVKPLLQFRCVSKCYNSIITSSDFITKHFKHNLAKSSVSDNNNDYLLCKAQSVPTSLREGVDLCTLVYNSSDHTMTEVSRLRMPVSNNTVVGICNGIFCLVFNQFTSVFNIYLWNPNIRKFKILPSTHDSFEALGCGFGYCHIQNNDFDFKVLRFGHFLGNDKELAFQVYTLSTDSWKQLGSFNGSRGPVDVINLSTSLFFNGALHFIAYSHHHKFILSFDLHDENFREIMLPQNYSNGTFINFEQFAVLEGSLALIAFEIPVNGFIEVGDILIEKCRIWVMRVYGDVDSWTTIVALKDVEDFFGCTGSGELVFVKPSSPRDLILFDPKSLDEKIIGTGGDLYPEIYKANLMENLVLLNERN